MGLLDEPVVVEIEHPRKLEAKANRLLKKKTKRIRRGGKKNKKKQMRFQKNPVAKQTMRHNSHLNDLSWIE